MRFALPVLLLAATSVCASSQEWVRLVVEPTASLRFETELVHRDIPVIAADSATVELSDYNGVQDVKVAELPRRLTPLDPRWDPWLKLWTSEFNTPTTSGAWIPSSAVAGVSDLISASVRLDGPQEASSPIRLAMLTLTGLGILGLILFGTSLFFGQRRAFLGVIFCVLLVVLGGLALGNSRGVALPEPAQTLAAMYRQHLWYQWALPYGAHWSDFDTAKSVVLAEFVRRGSQIVPAPTVVFTPDSSWFSQRFAERGPTNVALLLGKVFP